MGLRLSPPPTSKAAAQRALTLALSTTLNAVAPGSGVLARPILGNKLVQRSLRFSVDIFTAGQGGKLVKKFFHSDPHTALNEHAIKDASKAFWEGRGTDTDLRTLLTPDPFGLPYLVADYDVLGSAKLLQKRYIAESAGEGYAEAVARARKFLAQDPATLSSTFNENQLTAFRAAGLFTPPASAAGRRRALRI